MPRNCLMPTLQSIIHAFMRWEIKEPEKFLSSDFFLVLFLNKDELLATKKTNHSMDPGRSHFVKQSHYPISAMALLAILKSIF